MDLSPRERFFCHRFVMRECSGLGFYSDKRDELVDGETGLPNNRAQSAAIEFFVVRNGGLRGR
jgi:hypothetical protein